MAAPEDFVPDGAKPGDFVPDPSVMDPHPVQSGLKRIGKTIGQYDPSNPANMGRVAPLVAGAATASAGALTEDPGLAKLGLSIIGGAASPYAEYAASKATGGNPDLPDWKEALRSGVLNGMFEMSAGKSEAFREGASTTKTEVSQLPEELRTPANIRAAVKNRDFLKKLGMNDQQIDEALKDPAGTADAIQRSIDRGKKVTDNLNATITNERARFKARYDDAYGAQANAPVDAKTIADQMRQLAQGQTQHELTPSFKNFLQRKAQELDPAGASKPYDTAESIRASEGEAGPQPGATPIAVVDSNAAKENLSEGLYRRKAAAKTQPFNVQSARDLRSELRENVPGQATPLDQKAAGKLNDLITDQYEQGLRKANASEEQIGRLKGIDADYGMFQQTIKGLRPGSKEFGEQTADAFFKTAKQNPTLALNYVRMAEDAGTMPEFRESFLNQLTQTMRGTSGGPVNEMQVLRTLQDQWRTTDDGKAVLSAVFGKNSPMADPTEFSKIYGAAGNSSSLGSAKSVVSKYLRSPDFIVRMGTFYATYSLIVGSGASPWTDMRKNPERAMTGLVGAMLTTAGINKVMSQVSPPIQRQYSKWITTGDPEAFANLIRMTGVTTTALTSQSTSTDSTK